jgi:hypothetical protein
MNTTPDFGTCPCGGRFEARFVPIRMPSRDGTIVLDDVAQGACPSCGSRVYRAGTLAHIENAYHRAKRSFSEERNHD